MLETLVAAWQSQVTWNIALGFVIGECVLQVVRGVI